MIFIPIILMTAGALFIVASARSAYRSGEAEIEGDHDGSTRHTVTAFICLLIGAAGLWYGAKVGGWI